MFNLKINPMYGNHFKFEELIHTETGLDNMPDTDSHLANLASLWNVLNFVREKLGRPIIVNSAFRTPQVNKQVGGAKRSLHMQGRAADIYTDPLHMDILWKILEQNKDDFSELIKYPTFYHVAI